jgi:hypothetical protein
MPPQIEQARLCASDVVECRRSDDASLQRLILQAFLLTNILGLAWSTVYTFNGEQRK